MKIGARYPTRVLGSTWIVVLVSVAISLAIRTVPSLAAPSLALVPQQPLGPVDYIIISHAAVEGPALEAFFNLKVSQGYNYLHFSIDDGVWTDSIYSIIRTIYDSTDFAPQYVLLVGTAKSDPGFDSCQCDKYAKAADYNMIPTPYAYDLFDHRTGYDQWYTWLEPWHYVTHIPDVIIGRIPVRSNAEMQQYVDKLTAYVGDTADAAWKRRAFLVAGDKNRGPFPDFPSPEAVNINIDELSDSLPSSVSTSIIRHSDFSDDPSRKLAFINALDAGQGLVFALATGSHVGNLGWIIQRPDFDAETDLSNTGLYPVMVAISCNLGQVDEDVAPGEESLAENLLLAPSRGVVGIIGPSGFSSDISNFILIRETAERLYERGITRLGNLCFSTVMTLKARHRGPSDTYDMMTVLGDPGMEIDLGSINDHQPTLRADFEMIDPVPHQNRQHYVGLGLDSVQAGVVKNKAVWGRRAYRISGYDEPANDPQGYWTLYDDLGIVIDSSTRFLTYYVKPMTHPEGVGQFGVDCFIEGEGFLSGCTDCGLGIWDQYDSPLAASSRSAPLGEKTFYAFDLASAYGKTISKVLVEYNALYPSSEGHFESYFDEIHFSPTWGSPPDVGPIEMPANVYTNSISNVSISADDQDILLDGDDLTVEWSATDGTIVGTGLDVEYHAPDVAVLDVEIKAVIFDQGGHVDSSLKTIGVFPPGGGGGCPHLFALTSGEYVDEGALLTRSRFDDGNPHVRDALPLLAKPTAMGGTFRFTLREAGSDVTTFDRVALTLVSTGRDQRRTGMTTDGRVVKMSDPILPFYCSDDQHFDQLAKVSHRDGNVFRAYGPGYLIVSYRNLLSGGLPKIDQGVADGGGNGIDPPPKGVYKVAVTENERQEPDSPNYVAISVYGPGTGWTEVDRIAPRSRVYMPQLVDLLPYVDADGYLLLKISWTWSFSADDLSFYRFSRAGVTDIEPILAQAIHSSLGEVTGALAIEDGNTLTLQPGEEIVLDFDSSQISDYDLAIMKFVGKYEHYIPGTGRRLSQSVTEQDAVATLDQNIPNPFNAGTRLSFWLPHEGSVDLSVFNVLGQRVSVIKQGFLEPGEYEFTWEGVDGSGRPVPSGVYFYALRFDGAVVSKKMLVLK